MCFVASSNRRLLLTALMFAAFPGNVKGCLNGRRDAREVCWDGWEGNGISPLFITFSLYGKNAFQDVFRSIPAKRDSGSHNWKPAKADNFYHVNTPARFAGRYSMLILNKLPRLKSSRIETFSCKPWMKNFPSHLQ